MRGAEQHARGESVALRGGCCTKPSARTSVTGSDSAAWDDYAGRGRAPQATCEPLDAGFATLASDRLERGDQATFL
jgi:hypothetical protein